MATKKTQRSPAKASRAALLAATAETFSERPAPVASEAFPATAFEEPAPVEPEMAETAITVEAPLAAAETRPEDIPAVASETIPAPTFEEPAPEIAETVYTAEAPLAAAEAPPENIPAVVEPSVVEGRADARSAAEAAVVAVGASLGAARDGVIALHLKTLEAITAEADAHLDMLASLAGARSISDVVTIQAEFVRKRFEESANRARALADLVRKVADDTAAPIQAHVAKTLRAV